METKINNLNAKNRFLKLSLKKNRQESTKKASKLNRSSDVIVLDESYEKLRQDFPNVHLKPKIYSPIVINDSTESSFFEDAHDDKTEPSKHGNVSFNCSKEESTPRKEPRPSIGGWSPAQSIICATPRTEPLPSIPREIANESMEECSIKKIQQSQKKLLTDLYGDVWKNIPNLIKSIDIDNAVSKRLQFDDDDSDKENVREHIREHKKLYLTESEAKRKVRLDEAAEKRSKKKLYTEKVPNTPEPRRPKTIEKKSVTTTKKKNIKGKSVTELVEIMNDVESLTDKVKNITVHKEIGRLSFMASLSENVPSWRCNTEAIQYLDNFKQLKEKLVRRMFDEFNKNVFDRLLDNDLPILWDNKLRSTAGTTTNRLIKNSKGVATRMSTIKLSSKVVTSCERARDTLVHELCHAATWLLDYQLRAGHGPLWQKWAAKALQVYPELGEISRCHDMQIQYKYTYKCTKCGYSIQRHSKSIDATKKCCGYCCGTFEIILNRQNKDGVVVSTPARKAGPNEFAMFVKENYSTMKNGRTHAEVMKMLGEQFSARKKPKEA